MTGDAPLVLVYDPITAVDWSYRTEREALTPLGIELVVAENPAAARELLPGAAVAIVSQRMSADDLRTMPAGSTVLCYSVGMDGVDARLAAERGINVRNVPDYCTDEVAEHAVTLMMALLRSLVPTAVPTGAGDWTSAYRALQRHTPRRIRDQVVGVVGLGRIGTGVAERCRGLGMTVLGYDPYLSSAPGGVEMVDFATLLTGSDVVVLCAALTAGSAPLLDADTIATMRPGSVLINVARGKLVDETALADALRTGRLSGAGLDVRASEPPDPESDPLAGLENVLLTPHMGATSVQARIDLHLRAVDAVVRILTESGRLPAGLSVPKGSSV